MLGGREILYYYDFIRYFVRYFGLYGLYFIGNLCLIFLVSDVYFLLF